VPGLVFVYLFKRGEAPRIDMIAEGGIDLNAFPPGHEPVFPVDSSVVDLRGLAAGGSAPSGAPLAPIDSSIVDLRGLAAGGPPAAYHRDLTTIFGQPINVVVPPVVGERTELKNGKVTYQVITAALNAMNVTDAEHALGQRDKLEKARDLALDLWVTERAAKIISRGGSDWVQRLQALQNNLRDANRPFKLILDADIAGLAKDPIAINALRAALASQQKQLAAQVDAALADPALKAASTQTNPAARTNSWPCAADGMFCTKGNVTAPGLGPVTSPGSQTNYATPSAQLNAMTGKTANGNSDPGTADCVFTGGKDCKQADPLVFNHPAQRPRGSEAVPQAAVLAMRGTTQGQKLLDEEKTLQTELEKADAKLNEIRAKKEAATSPIEREHYELDRTKAEDDKSQIAQKLSVTQDTIETDATKYVLDPDTK
jgi:hypothetical protein